MFNQKQSTHTAAFTAAANHGVYTAPQPQQAVGPFKIQFLDATRQYLGNDCLTEAYLLDISRQAILSGHRELKYIDGVIYHQIVWNGLYFVFDQSFATLLLISRHDTSKVVPAQPQPTHNQFHILKTHHAEDTEEYEQIIDEIVDCVWTDMQAEHEHEHVDYAEYAECADQRVSAVYSASNDVKVQTPAPSEHNQSLAQSNADESAEPISECTFNGESYHTIYLKPIMERLSQCEPSAKVTGEYVAEIVFYAVKSGVKRQISKRTFSFSWDRYTVVMSKSLKTILDVAVAREGEAGEVVTVHPDVVSILAKRHPSLDYFEIQRVAEKAKESGEFTTKKNDYRRQFIYDFKGYHIVFASNHSTIVEMQCRE